MPLGVRCPLGYARYYVAPNTFVGCRSYMPTPGCPGGQWYNWETLTCDAEPAPLLCPGTGGVRDDVYGGQGDLCYYSDPIAHHWYSGFPAPTGPPVGIGYGQVCPGPDASHPLGFARADAVLSASAPFGDDLYLSGTCQTPAGCNCYGLAEPDPQYVKCWDGQWAYQRLDSAGTSFNFAFLAGERSPFNCGFVNVPGDTQYSFKYCACFGPQNGGGGFKCPPGQHWDPVLLRCVPDDGTNDEDRGLLHLCELRDTTGRLFLFYVDGFGRLAQDLYDDDDLNPVTSLIDANTDCRAPWFFLRDALIEGVYLRGTQPVFARSRSHGASFNMVNVPGSYTNLAGVPHRGRFIVLGFRAGTWYARVGNLQGDNSYLWSGEVALSLPFTPKGAGGLIVDTDGQTLLAALNDTSGGRHLVRGSVIDLTAHGTWR